MRKLYVLNMENSENLKYDLLADIADDQKVLNLREKLLGGMYSDSIIRVAKNIINMDSKLAYSRDEFIFYLKSSEFSQEMDVIQDLVWLNPDEIYRTLTEFMICLGYEAGENFLHKDPTTVEFLRVYCEFISQLGYKDLNKHIIDNYPKYFKKIA